MINRQSTSRINTRATSRIPARGYDAPSDAMVLNYELLLSLRKLADAFNGPVIKVRRSSDNALQDFYFNTQGELDTDDILAFVGSGSGFINTWYDQSGSNFNATQSTLANQPMIVNAGVPVQLAGKLSIDFDGTNDTLVTSHVRSHFASIVTVNNFDDVSGSKSIISNAQLGNLSSSQWSFFTESSAIKLRSAGSSASDAVKSGLTTLTDYINWACAYAARNWEVAFNDSEVGSIFASTSIPPVAATIIGGLLSSPIRILNGRMSEVLIITDDQRIYREQIIGSINSYFKIF